MNLPSTFTFNGMLKTNEIAGEGNSYDFGARMHDGRLGRWLSLDPCEMKFPSLSPYNFAANNPIYYVDKDGRIIKPWGDIASINLFVSQLQKATTLKVEYDIIRNQIIISGDPRNKRDRLLLEISQSESINVNMYLTDAYKFQDLNKNEYNNYLGSFLGSEIREDGTVETSQQFAPGAAQQIEDQGAGNSGRIAAHELIESYLGGVYYPGYQAKSRQDEKTPTTTEYNETHKKTNKYCNSLGEVYYNYRYYEGKIVGADIYYHGSTSTFSLSSQSSKILNYDSEKSSPKILKDNLLRERFNKLFKSSGNSTNSFDGKYDNSDSMPKYDDGVYDENDQLPSDLT